MIRYTTCDAGKNMRQECRVKEKESDSSAGRKRVTICCWLPAVPPLSQLTFPLFFLPISPAVYEGTQSVSVSQAYTPGTPHTHRLRSKYNTKQSRRIWFQLICDFILYIYTLSIYIYIYYYILLYTLYLHSPVTHSLK